MIEYIESNIVLINLQIFFISILVFFIGYTFAPTAYFKNIKWLTAYPLWMSKKLERLAKVKWNPVFLFFFLLIINSTSLFAALLTGLVPMFPVFYAMSVGFNIGVITYHNLKGKLYYAALLNPVALFELPAAFIVFTMSFQYNLQILNIKILNIKAVSFNEYLNVFLFFVIPLLTLASIVETTLIIISRKIKVDDNDDIDSKF
jgi:uncharacterized membrane protein SpoIIM required for sporulation